MHIFLQSVIEKHDFWTFSLAVQNEITQLLVYVLVLLHVYFKGAIYSLYNLFYTFSELSFYGPRI